MRFLRGVRRPLRGMPTTNLGEGYGFHYSPELAEGRPTNFDTPEYSHIVATTLLYHREARAAGMKRLPAAGPGGGPGATECTVARARAGGVDGSGSSTVSPIAGPSSAALQADERNVATDASVSVTCLTRCLSATRWLVRYERPT